MSEGQGELFNVFFRSVWIPPLAYLIGVVITLYLVGRFSNVSKDKIPFYFLFSVIPLGAVISTEVILNPGREVDVQLHDTYFVIAHLQITIAFIIILLFWAVVYYLTPKVIKAKLNKLLSYLHFWLIQISIFVLMACGLLSFHNPRRYYTFEGFDDPFKYSSYISVLITVFALVLIFASFLYLLNLIYTLILKKKKNEKV